MLRLRSEGHPIRNTLSTAGNSMTSSERPSPEPIPEKEAFQAVLRGGEFWKCSGSLKCLEVIGFGGSKPYSRGGKTPKTLSFRTFSGISARKVPAVLGVWPNYTGGMAQLSAT